MFENKRFLAVIPARGGSKGIPDKNIMDIEGTPLIAYSINSARKSRYIDRVVVSTDSEKIAEVSKKYNAEVPFLRPSEISTDTARSIDVVLHSVDFFEQNGEVYDYVVLLQPTSPLRTADDIDNAVERIAGSGRESLVSMRETDENPFLMRTIKDDRLQDVIKYDGSLRRQDLPSFYIFNGAIYITSVKMLKAEQRFVNDDTLPYVMNKEKSIDIDTMFDAKIAGMYIKENENVQNRK